MPRSAPVLVALLVAVAGCRTSRVPEWAHGKAKEIDPATADTDVIAYRTLVREDFRAADPPPSFAAYREKVGAATCAYVRTTPHTRVEVRPSTRAGETPRYDAAPHDLVVEAVMSRSCSWWNPDQRALPADYVLQHEQIHFALYELATRRFNAEVPAIAAHCTYSGTDPKPLVEQSRSCMRGRIDAAMRAALEENRRFDEDTSFAHEPAKQRAWWSRVQRELASTPVVHQENR